MTGTEEIAMINDLQARLTTVASHLAQQYAGDKLAPGIHFAWLADKKQWYVSIKRFRQGKETESILAKALAETPEAALKDAYDLWVSLIEQAKLPKAWEATPHMTLP